MYSLVCKPVWCFICRNLFCTLMSVTFIYWRKTGQPGNEGPDYTTHISQSQILALTLTRLLCDLGQGFRLLWVSVSLCVKGGQLPTVIVKRNEVEHVKHRLVLGTHEALGKRVPPPSAAAALLGDSCQSPTHLTSVHFVWVDSELRQLLYTDKQLQNILKQLDLQILGYFLLKLTQNHVEELKS